MVNGNYIVYGDRPPSESEYVDDHVQPQTVERKPKRKNRTANELQSSLSMVKQLDNETDSIKYEKKVKEPRLLRYVPTTDVEENFVAEKFETYDMKPGTEERPRKFTFMKKPRNTADGSVNYGYSRSSSSSPNANLPTISEHTEQYGTYRNRPKSDSETGFERKFDKYFIRSIDKKVKYDGTHPDSLYRVANGAGARDSRMVRVIKALRWPAALFVVCAALGMFVYFLMPSNTDASDNLNSTIWETGVSSAVSSGPPQKHPKTVVSSLETRQHTSASTASPTTERSTNTLRPPTTPSRTSKQPGEIDFYHPEEISEAFAIFDSITVNKKRPAIAPFYPDHLTPEVQYGDKDKGRTPKLFDDKNKLPEDSTSKPHITQKPEKPLAVFFKNALPTHAGGNPETLNRAETGGALDSKSLEKLPGSEEAERSLFILEDLLEPEPEVTFPTQEDPAANRNFTSGHSKIFGVGIEDLDKMKSTTQSSVYNTRVSPTLPTWRNTQDSTTINYPVNSADVSHCHSPRMRLCRGLLPYDLAGPSLTIDGVKSDRVLPGMEIITSSNCSSRLRQFVCALLEPECQPAPFPPKRPCVSLCNPTAMLCKDEFPRIMAPFLNCQQYETSNCLAPTEPCYEDEISCEDGTCVSKHLICDGSQDCSTGADEQYCSRSCQKNQYRCPSTGECIMLEWMCDGVNDCANSEDEAPEECSKHEITVFAKPKSFSVTTSERYLTDEPGEEGAGSAPAAAVTRYGVVGGRRDQRADDSSKEILVTSDSNNALKRNFTRRPSPQHRLSPYKFPIRTPIERTLPPIPLDEFSLENTPAPERRKLSRKKKPKPMTEKESNEKPGLLDSLERGDNEKKPLIEQSRPPVRKVFRNEDNKTSDYYERHINSKTMIEKMQKEEDEERRKKLRSPPEEMVVQKEEAAAAVGGRSSPCPMGELRCVDGRCITLAMLCDGNIDCSDHADEDNCFT